MRVRRRILVIAFAVSIVPIVALFYTGVWLWFRPSSVDRQAIESRYTLWHSALGNARFSDAYAFMSPKYRANHSLQEFRDEFRSSGESWLQLQPGYSLRVHGSGGRLYPLDDGLELWNGLDYEWIKVGDIWFLTGNVVHYYD